MLGDQEVGMLHLGIVKKRLTGLGGGRGAVQNKPQPPHRRNDSEDDYTSEKEHSFLDGMIFIQKLRIVAITNICR